jgi:hypothetical protein
MAFVDWEGIDWEGAVVIASSRSRSTEVLRTRDGRLWLVSHLKSGRDTVDPVQGIPDYLTVRYQNPPLAETPRGFSLG